MSNFEPPQANYEAQGQAMIDQAAIDDLLEKRRERQEIAFVAEVLNDKLPEFLGKEAILSISGHLTDCGIFDDSVLEIADDPGNCRFFATRLKKLIVKHAGIVMEDKAIFNQVLKLKRANLGDDYDLL